MNNDLISRSALVERLKRNLNACNPGTFSERCYQDAINTVTHFPAVDAGPKWISTAERLPAIGETVLAFRGDFMEVLVYDKHHGQEDFFYMDECGYWQEAFRPSVTHWMPLPEPPEVKHE